ncbi:MAG: glycosyltransferase family 2 protein [Hydrogenovibrio sp.]|uniref:glycosyltransferase family 2 protein n=1 Tax=Hydrogenovibrio sp. TaxID=2065821 RepID=UPI0028700292|nr:glycosyltransferase family 2 protein [Hydrogenovibrio sp.]MDR9498513.1 glycosyltransferase family 2 protein [Hydrogenovibrio sp.]MDR9499257.1 glycosyltransferase family 2 protein [Hydrogenovibrio sp.]
MKLSIVATLYKSEPYIDEFYQRASDAAAELFGSDYEIVLVNDGSPDNSLDKAVALSKKDEKVKVVNLSRNFGHHKAMMTGLMHSSGELIFLIDSDLEEQPEWLELFYEKMKSTHADVVYGVQETRKGSWFERVSGGLFYKAFNLFGHVKIPANLVTTRLMSKDYVQALVLHKETDFFIAGLWQLTGFDQVEIKLKKLSISPTTYSLTKKLSLLVNAVTAFSNYPLILIFYLGVSVSLLSVVYIAYLMLNWFLYDTPLEGWTSLIASVWLFGGLILAALGVIGIYLGKVFIEVKRRPYTIIKSIYQNGEKQKVERL